MEKYQSLVENTLVKGTHKKNRTDVHTISTFGEYYEIDLSKGYPLLTTKKMDGFRWDSMLHEVEWYLSGEHHVRTLQEHTKIWNEWADEDGNLDTAYGRFWRRYPIPDEGLDGESWPDETNNWVNEDEGTFDQIQYILDMLEENPKTRRMVVNAWHPANASVSTLPPCHYTFVFNVQGDGTLNVHLTQRSADIALGVPFNIAAYSLLAQAVAQHKGFELGKFGHSLVDAHIYCGKAERGEWYANNLDTIQSMLTNAADESSDEKYNRVREYIQENAPPQQDKYDHVPGLLKQLSRTPKSRPTLEIADKPLDELEYDDFQLHGYDSYSGLMFDVAE